MMSEFLAEYGLFLLKVATIVVAIVVVIGAAASAGRRSAVDGLEVDSLNKKYQKLAHVLRKAVLKKDARKQQAKEDKRKAKAEAKADPRPRGFVIDFKGDLKASAAASLREEVSAILEVASPDDQVILRLENHGGMVHEHGLAASQLARLRDRDIPLIVCVDKVAASGGYLMACVASRIHAAPFAVLGSIGVLAQIPNFHRLLDQKGVDFEQITAGKYKRTVTIFGKNTDADRAKLRDELEDVHALFKSAVSRYRPTLDLERVATGEHWYGTRARELGLVDEIGTSDELLTGLAAERDLFQVSYRIRQPIQKRLMSQVDGALQRFDAARWQRDLESRLPR